VSVGEKLADTDKRPGVGRRKGGREGGREGRREGGLRGPHPTVVLSSGEIEGLGRDRGREGGREGGWEGWMSG